MINYLAYFVSVISNLLVLLVIVAAILSFFMDPYHPVRRAIDSVVDPMLAPIRRVIPPVGGLDFSPLVLIILIQVLAGIIKSLLYSIH